MKQRLTLSILLLLFSGLIIGSQEYKRDLLLLKPRINGDDVKLVQQKLLSLGINVVGEADGWFGPNTEKAIIKYQEYLGFTPDGKVSESIWKTMFSRSDVIVEVESLIKIANSIVLSELRREEEDYNGHSAEGGYIVRYKKDLQTKYAVVQVLGEMGKNMYNIFHIQDGYVIINKSYYYPAPFEIENASIEIKTYYFTKKIAISIENGNIVNSDIKKIDIPTDWLK